MTKAAIALNVSGRENDVIVIDPGIHRNEKIPDGVALFFGKRINPIIVSFEDLETVYMAAKQERRLAAAQSAKEEHKEIET